MTQTAAHCAGCPNTERIVERAECQILTECKVSNHWLSPGNAAFQNRAPVREEPAPHPHPQAWLPSRALP